MNELSLFSGAGGGLLGSKILGWRSIGYVENNPYCQKILAQRISDGILDAAPIFGDIRKFISEGYATSYKGLVDIITGGFPCQPFSVAGKRKGEADERNMWPATANVIRAIRPPLVFLENVPGLLSSGYFGRILGDLAEIGYDARWAVLGASDVGANHRRKRLWIFCYTKHNGLDESKIRKSVEAGSGNNEAWQNQACKLTRSGEQYEDVAYANTGFSKQSNQKIPARRHTAKFGCNTMANSKNAIGGPDNKKKSRWAPFKFGRTACRAQPRIDWWETEPSVDRVAHELAYGLDIT